MQLSLQIDAIKAYMKLLRKAERLRQFYEERGKPLPEPLRKMVGDNFAGPRFDGEVEP